MATYPRCMRIGYESIKRFDGPLGSIYQTNVTAGLLLYAVLGDGTDIQAAVKVKKSEKSGEVEYGDQWLILTRDKLLHLNLPEGDPDGVNGDLIPPSSSSVESFARESARVVVMPPSRVKSLGPELAVADFHRVVICGDVVLTLDNADDQAAQAFTVALVNG